MTFSAFATHISAVWRAFPASRSMILGLVRPIRAFIAVFLTALLTPVVTEADDLVWQAALLRHTPAESPHYDAWLIIAGEFPRSPQYIPVAPPANFESTLEAVFAADKNPRISSIGLGNVREMDGLREQVITHLIETGALAPATAKKPIRWRIKNVVERGPEVLREAILKSDFVAALNHTLEKRGKRVSGVSLEKVGFLFHKDPPNWLATIHLYVDK